MNRRRDKALALILVMTVVMALAIIATPFVLSMILQERTGTAARYLSQADYGADGAKNYAMWRLMLSVDYIERRASSGAASSYYYDTETEFDIRLDDDLKSRVKISDPKGSIWGLAVQDEQGKLNARTCGEAALRNLSSMVDGRVINLKDYVTLYSGRDMTWVAPQRIRAQGFQNGTGGGGPTVDNLFFLGPRSRVRLSKLGLKPLETRISGNAILGGGGQAGFTTEANAGAYMDGVIEVEQRHPVNINTAKRETLTAMFEGLRIFGDGASLVSRNVAEQLATRCAGRNFTRLEEFLTAVASSPLNPSQRRAVLLNSVCPNFALLDGSGTVPICFKSYDVYTIEAFSSMNNPAGTEVAGRGYREVVSVSPPTPLRRFCESQYDFSQMMSLLQTAMIGTDPRFAFPGYPYGNRLLSYPRLPNEQADVALKPNQAYITVTPSEDHRGETIDRRYEQDLQGWPDPHTRNHYANERDGKKMSGAESFAWNQFFALNHTSEDDELTPGQQRPDTGSGGFEVWARMDGGGDVTLFDIQEAPTTNRVSLRVEGSDLILTAADATIPYPGDPGGRIANGVAEIRWPNFKIAPDTWTHFSAYWKSNRYADLAMLVDGFSDPQAKFMHYTAPGGQELMTKLGSALPQNSTSLVLKNSGILPSGNEPTPLLIGEEVVLYDGGACVRGARGTVAVDHPSQATVSLFGYSSKVKVGTISVDLGPFRVTMNYDRIPQTNATCLFNFNVNPIAVVAGDKQNPGPPPYWEIDSSQNQIGVTTGNIMDFPDQGYIRIENELVFYTGRSTGGTGAGLPPSTAKFTGCARGQLGTMAVAHRSGVGVDLWSVAVTNANKFPCATGGPGGREGTIIQIGDEWFGPVQPIINGGFTFWVSYLNGANPLPLRRGTLSSIPSAHSAGDRVLPTFLCMDVNRWPSRGHSVGAFDRVTLADRNNVKQLAKVQRAGPLAPPGQLPTWPTPAWQVAGNPAATQMAALTDHASRDWIADDLHVRLLKFPSGELLSRAFLDTVSPQVSIGPWGGQIDELKAFAATKGRIRLAEQTGVADTNLRPQYTTAPIRQTGGLLKIGDEYVGYGNWDNPSPGPGTLSQVKRAWLNSNGEIHDRGDQIFFLQWVPVAVLSGDLTADDKVINLRAKLPGDENRYKKGYVLIDNEMILFEWNGNGTTLSMPAKWDGQTGLYRGMFGTQPSTHAAQTSLVYGMPFRTWDTFKPREFDSTMVYFQWGTKMDLAHWHSFKWNHEIPTQDKNIVIHAIARVDGKGEFWDPPTMSDHVMVVESLVSGSNVPINRTGYQHDAGQLDVRFYIEYKPGSFEATAPRTAESWKRYPKIRDIQVEYDRPTQTLHHEDR